MSHLIEYVIIKMNTMKTEITNMVTNRIDAKKNHLIIWAEENGSVSDGNLEWSFGNGTDNNIYFGLCIPVDGKITKGSICAAASSSTASEMRVNLIINGNEEANYQVKKRTGNYSDTTKFQTPLVVSKGDRLNFISRSTNSSVTHAIVSVLIEF